MDFNRVRLREHSAPCANCHKEDAGDMKSSEWTHHDEWVCSEACGQRLNQKIKNGMLDPDKYPTKQIMPWGITYGLPSITAKEKRLRQRIKQLEDQLRRAKRERSNR